MSGNLGSIPPSGAVQPPVTNNTDTRNTVTPNGEHKGTPVSSLQDVNRELDSLKPDQTLDTSVHKRKTSVPSIQPEKQIPTKNKDKPETPQEKHDRELEEAREARENSSLEDLEAEQEKLLEEAGEKFEKVEQHTVLGKALAALKDPANAPRDVKVTLQLPGEAKPVSLVPPDNKALAGRNVEELTALATKLLTQFNTDHLADFNAGEFNQRLGMIREMLEDVGKKISEKGKGGNDWQKRFEELQQRQAVIVAREKLPEDEDDGKRVKVTVTSERPEKSEKTEPEKPESVNNEPPPRVTDDTE